MTAKNRPPNGPVWSYLIQDYFIYPIFIRNNHHIYSKNKKNIISARNDGHFKIERKAIAIPHVTKSLSLSLFMYNSINQIQLIVKTLLAAYVLLLLVQIHCLKT
ncbi:hypothetical protein BpHYR1_030728 [Brachionus plicatilis]|uniref:Uncharacterized protein n=1 Tax=Brachionus plicatilis TaxID=10195 RepID=A0A3M7RHZ6_BRAPC|nr:hypothetical protein BpHYR1_030728 [Brachionus plicatilis]